ncbi:MAG: GGDEF domain-containing protein [Syntrophomonas sp.]|nr:GGDEF domain-containing protein [Syntrophomonas sp.]
MVHKDLKKQLYIKSLYVTIFFSVLAIFINLLLSYPLLINIKWLFLLVFTTICLQYERYIGLSDFLKFVFFLFVVGIIMPLSFVNAGGSQSFTFAYEFIALIVATYVLEGHYRNIVIATIIIVFMGMYTYDYMFPEKIPVYDAYSLFIDRLIQIPILMYLCFLLVRRFADAYSQTHEQLLIHAHYDELTGLLNRRNFREYLQRQLDSSDHKGFLVMMDIDNFKLINDKRGHLAGDDSLKHLGNLLKQYFDNGNNMISRWGGDEFIVIYFGDGDRLDSILEKLKTDFKNYIEPIEPLVDISIGVASLEECKIIDDVLAKSDQIMYEKKRIKKHSQIISS